MAEDNAVKTECYYKVVVLGDAGVGKTALILKYVYDSFNPTQLATVGVEFLFKRVTYQDEDIKLQIWDTVGQERFAPLAESYCRNADAVILCYDITDSKSFYNIEKWIDDYPMPGNPLKVLVGCKLDMAAERVIPTEEGQEKARFSGFPFFEVSVLNDINIDEVFHWLVSNLANRIPNNWKKKNEVISLDTESISLDTESEPRRKKKCKC